MSRNLLSYFTFSKNNFVFRNVIKFLEQIDNGAQRAGFHRQLKDIGTHLHTDKGRK